MTHTFSKNNLSKKKRILSCVYTVQTGQIKKGPPDFLSYTIKLLKRAKILILPIFQDDDTKIAIHDKILKEYLEKKNETVKSINWLTAQKCKDMFILSKVSIPHQGQ